MQLARPWFATDPKLFGKGRARNWGTAARPANQLNSDLKLFLTTFAAGFLFVSILIG